MLATKSTLESMAWVLFVSSPLPSRASSHLSPLASSRPLLRLQRARVLTFAPLSRRRSSRIRQLKHKQGVLSATYIHDEVAMCWLHPFLPFSFSPFPDVHPTPSPRCGAAASAHEPAGVNSLQIDPWMCCSTWACS